MAQGSHFQGSDISYQHIGGNQYKVTVSLYRDCSGADLPSTVNLYYRTTGCTGSGTTTSMSLAGPTVIGQDYCATISGGPPCGQGLPTNYQRGTFEATVTLAPGRWSLSVEVNARPALANIQGETDFYTEAILDNTGGVANNSATFTTLPAQFVGWKLPTVFSQLALDTDGDSLVYSLVPALQGCNDLLPYQSFLSSTFIDLTPIGGTPCVGQLPAGLTSYSPTFPLPSFVITGTCPLKQATPQFDFDPATGSMAFTPLFYTPGTTVGQQAQNKYAVAVQVSEYRRRAGGGYAFVGSTRRDLLFVVVDCGPNQNPTLAPLRVNNNPTPRLVTDVIPVVAGQAVSLQLSATDANAGQLLTLSSNAEQLLPNSEFLPSGPALQPTATLAWLPPATLRPGLYYCTVTTTDNACPTKGREARTLAFRVSNTALGTTSARQATALAAVPTPFRGQVRFPLAQPGAQTVTVADRLGRHVATLRSTPGGEVVWQPGPEVPAGLYLARTADGRQVARLLRTDVD